MTITKNPNKIMSKFKIWNFFKISNNLLLSKSV